MANINITGGGQEGVQVVDGQGRASAVLPAADLEIVGYDDVTSQPAVVTLVQGTNISLQQSGTNIVVNSTSGTAPVITDIDSPVNWATATLAADIPLTTAWVSSAPAYSAVQPIATLTIPITYVTSDVSTYIFVPFSNPTVGAANQLSIGIFVYDSPTATTPLDAVVGAVQAPTGTLTSDKGYLIELLALAPGTTSYTLYIGATLGNGATGVTILSSDTSNAYGGKFAFYALMMEMLPLTIEYIDSQQFYLASNTTVSKAYTVYDPVADNTTWIGQFTYVKKFPNTTLRLCQQTSFQASYQSGLSQFVYQLSQDPTSTATPWDYFQDSGCNTALGNTGFSSFTSLLTNIPQGPLSVVIGAAYQGATWTALAGSSTLVEELLLVSPAGGRSLYQQYPDTFYSSFTSTGISTTTPTYGELDPLYTYHVGPQMGSGTLFCRGTAAITSASPVNVGTEVIFAFYATNDSAAEPIATIPVSFNGYGWYCSTPFFFSLPYDTNETLELYCAGGAITGNAATRMYFEVFELSQPTTYNPTTGVTWYTISSAGTTTMQPYSGYIVTTSSAQLVLPTAFAVGDVIEVVAQVEGVRISQNAGQQLLCNAGTTTTGTSGYIQTENTLTVGTLIGTVATTQMSATFSGNVLVN